jgi:hypothetical protein
MIGLATPATVCADPTADDGLARFACDKLVEK